VKFGAEPKQKHTYVLRMNICCKLGTDKYGGTAYLAGYVQKVIRIQN